MSEYVNAYLVTNEVLIQIDLDVGMKSNSENIPSKLLKGTPEIVGALPEKGYVLLGAKQTNPELYCNTNEYFKDFNHDGNLKGDILVIRTNDNGDPIDISAEKT